MSNYECTAHWKSMHSFCQAHLSHFQSFNPHTRNGRDSRWWDKLSHQPKKSCFLPGNPPLPRRQNKVKATRMCWWADPTTKIVTALHSFASLVPLHVIPFFLSFSFSLVCHLTLLLSIMFPFFLLCLLRPLCSDSVWPTLTQLPGIWASMANAGLAIDVFHRFGHSFSKQGRVDLITNHWQGAMKAVPEWWNRCILDMTKVGGSKLITF